jgi:hypothetical protein
LVKRSSKTGGQACVPLGDGALWRLRRVLRGGRSRLATIAVVIGLGAGVVIAHGALAMDHMGEEAAACLAVLDTGFLATGLAFVRRRLLPSRPRSPLRLGTSPPLIEATRPQPPFPIRAGPAALQVFRR